MPIHCNNYYKLCTYTFTIGKHSIKTELRDASYRFTRAFDHSFLLSLNNLFLVENFEVCKLSPQHPKIQLLDILKYTNEYFPLPHPSLCVPEWVVKGLLEYVDYFLTESFSQVLKNGITHWLFLWFDFEFLFFFSIIILQEVKKVYMSKRVFTRG